MVIVDEAVVTRSCAYTVFALLLLQFIALAGKSL
jgi:hypothetical protein